MRERMIHFFQMMRGDEGKENAKDGEMGTKEEIQKRHLLRTIESTHA